MILLLVLLVTVVAIPAAFLVKSPAARLGVGFLLVILTSLSFPMDFGYGGEWGIWRRFWLGIVSTVAIVTFVPIFWRGGIWQRVLAGVLLLVPLFGLFEACRSLSS